MKLQDQPLVFKQKDRKATDRDGHKP
uniref:Uncharacterized protein n=1 Tax=Arundo donax TaxID=35708 RepID=A0A0A9F958_ARUDO